MNDPFAWVADAACNGRDDIDWFAHRRWVSSADAAAADEAAARRRLAGTG